MKSTSPEKRRSQNKVKIQRKNHLLLSIFQSISIAIQQGNTARVMGCPLKSEGLKGLVFKFHVQEEETLR